MFAKPGDFHDEASGVLGYICATVQHVSKVMMGMRAAGLAGAAGGAPVPGAGHHGRDTGRPAALHLLSAVVAHRQAPPRIPWGPSAVPPSHLHQRAYPCKQMAARSCRAWLWLCRIRTPGCCMVHHGDAMLPTIQRHTVQVCAETGLVLRYVHEYRQNASEECLH